MHIYMYITYRYAYLFVYLDMYIYIYVYKYVNGHNICIYIYILRCSPCTWCCGAIPGWYFSIFSWFPIHLLHQKLVQLHNSLALEDGWPACHAMRGPSASFALAAGKDLMGSRVQWDQTVISVFLSNKQWSSQKFYRDRVGVLTHFMCYKPWTEVYGIWYVAKDLK